MILHSEVFKNYRLSNTSNNSNAIWETCKKIFTYHSVYAKPCDVSTSIKLFPCMCAMLMRSLTGSTSLPFDILVYTLEITRQNLTYNPPPPPPPPPAVEIGLAPPLVMVPCNGVTSPSYHDKFSNKIYCLQSRLVTACMGEIRFDFTSLTSHQINCSHIRSPLFRRSRTVQKRKLFAF
jgi:hypothetical protein